MLYVVKDEDYQSENIDDIISYCIDKDYYDRNDDNFCDWVNETYDCVEIEGRTYYPYDILCEFGDLYLVEEAYQARMCEEAEDDARYELLNANVGREVYIQNHTVLCQDKEIAVGDTDGDELLADMESCIERIRKEAELRAEEEEKQQKENEDLESSYMNLFQKLG